MAVTTRIRREQVPDGLKATDRWVCWRAIHRNGKQTKRPVSPTGAGYASVNDSATWTDFETALAATDRPDVDGLGFVFTETGPYVGVDLDDCRDPETSTLDSWAQAVVTTLGSYAEVSPSGTGVHVIGEGEVPGDRRRRGSVEMYDAVRFFTITGDRLADAPTEVRPTPRLEAVYNEYLRDDEGEQEDAELSEFETCERSGATDRSAGPETDTGTSDRTKDETSTGVGQQTGTNGLTDDEIVQKARTARNGDLFTRLWNGNTSSYDSHSEADLALCNILAFWTGKDPVQIDRLFRQSGLMRPKWDDNDTAGNHYADGTTYGEKTIERALKRVETTYSSG